MLQDVVKESEFTRFATSATSCQQVQIGGVLRFYSLFVQRCCKNGLNN